MNQNVSIRKFRFSRRRLWAMLGVGVAIVCALGLVAPMVDASRYGERIRQTLEMTLGRSVQFEAVHFTLFSGPGFSLEGVTIGEDPHYGPEPFAYVPEMQVRVRPDKLLLGLIQISSLRLLAPSLNLVKREDGTWNALELVQRLSAPRRMPLSFFPVFEVARGRIDFKFGTRKTTLYLSDADLQIYPEHSSKLSIRFSGSPARTDRAGNGFGHLHGAVTWGSAAPGQSNNLEADLNLDPSNLSEMTTLVQGHDVGVHGTVSSHVVVEGPISSLKVRGRLQLNDLHRWDLLPSNASDWVIPYQGSIDLLTNRLEVATQANQGPSASVAFRLVVSSIFVNPQVALIARLDRLPIENAVPFGRRMGLSVPSRVSIDGNVSGDVGFTSQAGLSGTLSLQQVTATMPGVPPLHAERVESTFSNERMIFQPARFITSEGVILLGGEVALDTARSYASVAVQDYPIAALKQTLGAWFTIPAIFDSLTSGGHMTGALAYSSVTPAEPVWSGKFDFSNATMRLPGWSIPLSEASGRVVCNGSTLDLSRFSARKGKRLLQATYRYNESARRSERLHVEMPVADFEELESMLAPAYQGEGWLARLGMSSHSVPSWLAERDMDADLEIKQLRSGETNWGSLSSHFTLQGANLRVSALRLKLPAGTIQAEGTATLAGYRPSASFTTALTAFPWHGGLLDATGDLQTSGFGNDAMRNLHGSGTFNGTNLRLTTEDAFPAMSGAFVLSFRDGWPDLKLTGVQASDHDGHWSGAGAARNDGQLVLDLERAGQQRHVLTSLAGETAEASMLVASH